MKKVYFKTFGCRTNQFDTQVMIANLKDFEVTTKESEANYIVVNSCTVTNSADSTLRNYINKMEKQNKQIYLTGCSVYTQGDKLFNNNKVFGVFGHSKKESVNELLKGQVKFLDKGTINHIDKTIVSEFVGKSRAFIKIQEGCDFRCSYCIIPSVRGDARNYNEEQILEQVNILAGNGFTEFILTGTNIGSYGKNSKKSLAGLLKKLSKINNVKRLRFGSIEPMQVTDELKEVMKEDFMGKHIHIALQHTSNKMLEIMNRRNRFETDLKLLTEISNIGLAIGTDYIIGHPYETDKIWNEAIINIKQLPLTHIHSFTYSKRDGTPSANMKFNVNGNISKIRSKEINQIILDKNKLFKQNNKEVLKVLIESKKDNIFTGLDQFFNRVSVESDKNLINKWIEL